MTKGVIALSLMGCVEKIQETYRSQKETKKFMLVLSRKIGEKLILDQNIIVEVVKIQGNRITLGVQAPAKIKILRGELSAQLKSEARVRTEVTELEIELNENCEMEPLLVAS